MIISLYLLSLLSLGVVYAQNNWKQHVEELFDVSDTVTHAAIIDRAGEIWARDKRFVPNQKEIQKLLSFFNKSVDLDEFSGQSFDLMGRNYEIIQAGVGTLLGRYEEEAFFAVSTRELIICVAYERTGPKNLIIRLAAIRLAQYLRIIGY